MRLPTAPYRAARFRISAASVAPRAGGSRTHQAAGTAAIATIPSTFSRAAARRGIPLLRRDDVPAAVINGAGPSAYVASAGRITSNGMKIKINRLDPGSIKKSIGSNLNTSS